MRSPIRAAGAALAAVVFAGACAAGGGDPDTSATTNSTGAPTSAVEGPGTTVLVLGDVSTCEGRADDDLAKRIEGREGRIWMLGDLVYPSGLAETFARCFSPVWQPVFDRIVPVAGNHEYVDDETAAGYFGLFGERAGTPGEGWYSFEEGGWRVLVVNSNCRHVGGCEEGSPQHTWLAGELATAATVPCSAVLMHHPRASSGEVHGDQDQVDDLWDLAVANGVDVVLAAHEHFYERFGHLDEDARPTEPGDGPVLFVVGTGGADHYEIGEARAGSEVRAGDVDGFLRLVLRPTGYDWRYVSRDGEDIDEGSAPCR